MDKKIIKLHEPALINKWYYSVDGEGAIGIKFLNGKSKNSEEGIVASVVKNPPALFVLCALASTAIVYLFTIFINISPTVMSFIIFNLFLVFVAVGFEYSLNRYGKNKKNSFDKVSINQPLSYTYNKLEVTRKIVALLNYLKDNNLNDSEFGVLSALNAVTVYDKGENYDNALSRLQNMFKDQSKFLDKIHSEYWSNIYPMYSSGSCKETVVHWKPNDEGESSNELEESNSFLKKILKLSDEFPNGKNFKIVAENYDKLSVIDQSSFRVICEELSISSQRLNEAVKSDNEELVNKLSPIFTNLLKKSSTVVDRIKNNLDEAIVDELRISDVFLGDKFHI